MNYPTLLIYAHYH